MRDYPSVPNVFRVASTQNVNNDGNFMPLPLPLSLLPPLGAGRGPPNDIMPRTTNSLNDQQPRLQPLPQQQPQLKLQQQPQQQKSLSSNPAAAIITANSSGSTANAPNAVTYSPAGRCSGATPKQQHYNSGGNGRCLIATSSMERNDYQPQLNASGGIGGGGGGGGARRDCIAYGAVPRSISGPGLLNLANSQHRPCVAGQQQPQQQPLPAQHLKSDVINTISGSIPATGFSTHAANVTNARRTTSVAGELLPLGGPLRNSCGDSKRLQQQQQHHQHHQQQQQQQNLRDEIRPDYAAAGASAAALTEYNLQRQQRLARGHVGRRVASSNSNNGYLWVLTPVAASISVAIVIAALAGPQWLFTEEKLPNANYNGTANFNAPNDGIYITKYTKSSLWVLCTTMQGVDTYNCIKIDYFPEDGYQPDPHESTPAIPYTVTKSCPFFLSAGIGLLLSFIMFLIPTCSHQNSLYYFSSGIMFIVSGLLMLIGMIAYISILKTEIGAKLRPRSPLQPPLFKVSYGQSFFLFVFGFVVTEFVGLLNIFLYISLQEVSYYSRLPCFTLTNLQAKIREGEMATARTHNTYKSYKPNTEGGGATGGLSTPRVRRGQVHSTQAGATKGATEAPLHGKKASQQPQQQQQQVTDEGFSSCRKHVSGEDFERRYYFDKPLCNMHSRNLARSLNELGTEPPAVSFGGLPPPPPPTTVRATLPRLQPPTQFADLPQEFPLTRSVSTTTDIHGSGAVGGAQPDGYGPMERKSQRNMATNTRHAELDEQRKTERKGEVNNQERDFKTRVERATFDYEEPIERFCGLRRGIRKSKDELFQDFCKRAGVRPRPKNIYYISNEEDEVDAQAIALEDERNKRSKFQASSKVPREAEEDDSGGFQPLQAADEEHIYVIHADNANSHNARRASMYAEPAHLRRLNSNLSLHTLCPPSAERYGQQSGVYELEPRDSTQELWSPLNAAVYAQSFGGSQQRFQQDLAYLQGVPRTLPRSFVRRNAQVVGSQDSLGSLSLQASSGALHGAYSASQNQLTNLIMHQQREREQRQLSHSRDAGLFHSALSLHKMPDYGANYAPRPLPVNAPVVNGLTPATVQWPAAIPSSPANYPAKYSLYVPPPVAPVVHPLVARSVSGGGGQQLANAAPTNAGPSKFQRAYAFEEQGRPTGTHSDPFDLDEIERDRRRSHASLFGGLVVNGAVAAGALERYDIINGTAV